MGEKQNEQTPQNTPTDAKSVIMADQKCGHGYKAIYAALASMEGAAQEYNALRLVRESVQNRIKTLDDVRSAAAKAEHEAKIAKYTKAYNKLDAEIKAMTTLDDFVARLAGPAITPRVAHTSNGNGQHTGRTAEYLAIADALYAAQGNRGHVDQGAVRKQWMADHPGEETTTNAIWPVISKYRPQYQKNYTAPADATAGK